MFNPDRSTINRFLFLDVLEYSIKVTHCVYAEKIFAKLEDTHKNYNPKMVAVSCNYMHTYIPTIEISLIVKKIFPNALLFSGGIHVGDITGIALNETEFDIIIQGEGEYAFKKFLAVIKGNIKLDCVGNLYFKDDLTFKYGVYGSKMLERFSMTDFVNESRMETF